MAEAAIRVEALSKRYTIGHAQQKHDTLRDAIEDFRLKIVDWGKRSRQSSIHNPQSSIVNPQSDDALWALKDGSFEACPEVHRRMQRGEVVG